MRKMKPDVLAQRQAREGQYLSLPNQFQGVRQGLLFESGPGAEPGGIQAMVIATCAAFVVDEFRDGIE